MSYTDLITEENFGVYAKIPSTSLTEEEKKSSPYSEFFEFPINLPPEETIRALLPGNEVDPSVAILPEECDKLFAPGYLECENGYCVLPQGFGFSAVKIDMPDVRPEMLPFMMPWFLDPVNYKIWLPDMHLESRVFVERNNAHAATENLGWGPKLPLLGAGYMLTPEVVGIPNPKECDPDFVQFFGGASPILPGGADLDAEPEGNLTMVNYIRRKGEGLEWRVRTWMGVFYNGEYIVDTPSEDEVPLIDRVRLMACHNAWEWNRMAALLPAIYKFAQENDLGMPGPGPRA